MTIQYYDWVSNNGKLNANGWSAPLRSTVYLISIFALLYLLVLLLVA